MKKIFFLLFLLVLSAPAFAQTVAPVPAMPTVAAPPGITIENAHAFATAPGQAMGAVFMTITNNGAEPDRLTGAAAPEVAGMAEIHTTIMEESTVMMVKMNDIEIPPGQSVSFDANGNHIMLMNLAAPLRLGQIFPIKLVFAKKGEVITDVTVRMPGEEDPVPED